MLAQCSKPVLVCVTIDSSALESWAPLFLTWVTVSVALTAPVWPSSGPFTSLCPCMWPGLSPHPVQPKGCPHRTLPTFCSLCLLWQHICYFFSGSATGMCAPLEQRPRLSCPVLCLQLLGEHLVQGRGSVCTFYMELNEEFGFTSMNSAKCHYSMIRSCYLRRGTWTEAISLRASSLKVLPSFLRCNFFLCWLTSHCHHHSGIHVKNINQAEFPSGTTEGYSMLQEDLLPCNKPPQHSLAKTAIIFSHNPVNQILS